MIFSTTYQAGQTGGHTATDTHQLGAAARRSLDALLSELYKPLTREWLQKNHWGQKRIRCVQADLTSWESEQPFDVVYTRTWAGGLSGLDTLLETIRQNLHTGGRLLLEVVSLFGFSAYPYNHALARSMELIGRLETPGHSTAALPERVQVLLQQAGFDTLEVLSSLPAFVPRTHNQAVSLALEACRDAILQCRGSTAEELNALLLELREFEAQGDTMISRPGLLQILAKKR